MRTYKVESLVEEKKIAGISDEPWMYGKRV